MPKIETKVVVNVPVEYLFKIAQDNSAFPSYMKDLESLTIIEKTEDRVISDWIGIIPKVGLKIRWQQEDIWDSKNYTCKFRQVKGNYDRLEGNWRFLSQGEQTLFESELEYEYNIPSIGPLIKKVIFNLVQNNMQNMLEAIKQRAETTYSSSQEVL